ncbi:methyl-accepting chemotaxis protein [Vibrio ostreicida]|uniref:Methyl-accepting chemotaxis protein n=1 Tax=Vibrio ostreicida TaxID=526588 RepID=A0ABT8BT47_9VIBR|nr:methyl-accepting chemotaxis protein [Vibrio ostreicida]MDN3610331.1 methyl-accepting chemotaxis protein [Vibrio ostreicida]NPD07655.1 methyl-accepting chemotaxis protein [Vibrio ostreicida]
MDILALSRKQKVTAFLVILTVGFVSLAVFTSSRLAHMSNQYHSSADISAGAISIYQTQSKILTVSSELDNLMGAQVGQIEQDIAQIVVDVNKDVSFLTLVNMGGEANKLSQSIGEFEAAVNPWLTLKQELGFNIDEGQLGQLKTLANVIEQKIAETGMVSLNSDFQAMVKSQQNYLLQPNQENLKLFNRAMGTFENMSNVYAMLDLYEKEIDQFKATFVRVSELSKKLNAVEQQLITSKSQLTRLIATVTTELDRISTQYQRSAEQSSEQTLWSILAACIVLAVFTIAIFILQSRSLSRSLSNTREILGNVSSGNLSKRMRLTNNPNDEFNQLAESINESCQSLGKLVSGVQENSQALSGNAADLNQGLDLLSHNQSEVLGQTQLLASATEDVSLTSQEVSNSLESVAEISRSSTESAEKGSQVIGAAIGSLEDVASILTSAAGHIQQLEQASTKVDSVMDIINGIAEQTNLLALNAAIEAARAGEQGRGFAVVADEVRNLAVRTVDAVAEISDTIETMKKESAEVIQYIGQSETSMKAGQERGHEAMRALHTITEKTDEAAQKTDAIFTSIKELASTSQSMANNMTQMSSAMKELEHNSEQLRSVSQLVEQRAGSLSSDCQRFTI